jgi:hypothetical protein
MLDRTRVSKVTRHSWNRHVVTHSLNIGYSEVRTDHAWLLNEGHSQMLYTAKYPQLKYHIKYEISHFHK